MMFCLFYILKTIQYSNMKDLDTIEPISARAELVIEEGSVEAIIDGYLFDFTIQEISNGTLIILLNSDTTKARNILI